MKMSLRVLLFLLIFPIHAKSQPYFDVAGLTFWHIPENNNSDAVRETEALLFISLPMDFGKGNLLIVSPSYQTRFLKDKNDNQSLTLQSTILPITWLHYSSDSLWNFTLTAVARSNDIQFRFNGDVFQIGGAVIGTYTVNNHLKLSAGLYYNREFFSDFYVPLAGIDWKISSRLNLFGTLPSELNLEYKISKYLYGGIAFRSITNSFSVHGTSSYYKINDMHLGLYADVYIGKRFVWNTEAGQTLFRSMKAREGASFPELNDDNGIIKTGLIYRVRLD